MNFRIIAYIVGWVCNFQAAFMMLPLLTAGIYREKDFSAFLLAMLVCLVVGVPLTRKKPKNKVFYIKDGCVAVALSWLALCIFGAIPFVASGCIPHPIDALFETVSGFTTTGSSILTDVEVLPHCILIWRSFTHWIGGMGVLVFLLSLLPLAGGYHMNLMKAESPGPSVSKLVPRVRDTAKILYGLYMAITVLGVIMLCLCGMPLFDSLCTTFGSVGTGGFGIKNSSIGGYSPLIQNAVTILMILSGVNYTVYFCLLSRQFKEAFSIEEVRWYFLIIFASALTIAWNIRPLYATLGETLRHSFFQVGTIITTTGFATTDFNMWPQLSKTILLLLMMIGACAGSTGGGIKVSRVLILFKAIRKELSMMIHPRMVKKIKMDGHNLSHETLRSTNVYMTAYFIVLFVSLLIVCLDEYDLSTNFTAVLATLNNIGPGLELVGPTQNFALFSPLSKCVLMFDMLAGRLELFPMLVILLPSCWKKY